MESPSHSLMPHYAFVLTSVCYIMCLSAVTMRFDLVIVVRVENAKCRFIQYKDRFFRKTFIIHQNITYLIKYYDN